ncbi:hypothetical protein J6590_062861 [Homalodisca vitripennis]|nr:hypothetical protein J6590_062861 [Homalodisca vitripennis]
MPSSPLLFTVLVYTYPHRDAVLTAVVYSSGLHLPSQRCRPHPCCLQYWSTPTLTEMPSSPLLFTVLVYTYPHRDAVLTPVVYSSGLHLPSQRCRPHRCCLQFWSTPTLTEMPSSPLLFTVLVYTYPHRDAVLTPVVYSEQECSQLRTLRNPWCDMDIPPKD